MPDLCTLADTKDWLGLTGSTAADATLTRLIGATSADFLREIDRYDLSANTYTERRTSDGTAKLLLRHWPINSVTSVAIDGVAIAESDGIASGWFVDMGEDTEKRVTLEYIGGTFPQGSIVVVRYNAGYATVPEDITQAVIEWAAYRYRGREFIGQTSKHLNQGETVSFQQVIMPDAVKAVVERYRRDLPRQ